MAGGKLLAWKVGGKRGYFVGEVGGGGGTNDHVFWRHFLR